MALSIGEAPSMGFDALQTPSFKPLRRALEKIELVFEAERTQLPLWLPVLVGLGVATWFAFPLRLHWIAVIAFGLAVTFMAMIVGFRRRFARILFSVGMLVALGCGYMWVRADLVGAPVLDKPRFAEVSGTILKNQKLIAKDSMRLTIVPDAGLNLPSRIRVNIPNKDSAFAANQEDRITLKARLMPPADAAVPGAYDFARAAWFQRLGATGKAVGQIVVTKGEGRAPSNLRHNLSAHINSRLEGSAAGIATALVTGDQGGVSAADQDAMRASGLAHLLSISGLHITAVVAAAMLISLKILALNQALALRVSLPVVAAAFGAGAGIGYTLLTGSEVPTVRSCVAALLVLIGLAMGREAMTLRLVATGALIILILWPESLIGPSFQLSFAAITALVALHELPVMQRITHKREEGWGKRGGRAVFSLLMTGLVVEIALAPVALFHFHKSGVYGALANIIAIPLTTFVIMPLEALALLFDVVGFGAPFWWLTSQALALLLGLAHWVSATPGAVSMLPSVPTGAYALIVFGGLWGLLWRTKLRFFGVLPFLIGCLWAVSLPRPDLLVTGDGRHLAIRGDDGRMAILRPRAGDYVRDTLSERSAYADELGDMDVLRGAQCSADICEIVLNRKGRTWRVLATRSRHFVPWKAFIAHCAKADIVVSDRRLPPACRPRWFKADRLLLAQTGGLAITFAKENVEMVRAPKDDHPWVRAIPVFQYRLKSPAKVP